MFTTAIDICAFWLRLLYYITAGVAIMTRLGIDIGGTGIKGALVNVDSGALMSERFRIPTPKPALPESIAAVVAEITAHFAYKGKVGIAFPSIVREGVIHLAANVDESWLGLNAESLFRATLGTEVSVVNDADAAGIAEMRFGSGQGVSGVVILLTLGTGIGSAVFLNGALLPNTEFGHLKIRGKDAELRASGRVREQKALSWKQWSKQLGELLVELELLLAPDLFIVGGGVSKKSHKFFPFLDDFIQCELRAAKMLNTAGIIGAAYQVR